MIATGVLVAIVGLLVWALVRNARRAGAAEALHERDGAMVDMVAEVRRVEESLANKSDSELRDELRGPGRNH